MNNQTTFFFCSVFCNKPKKKRLPSANTKTWLCNVISFSQWIWQTNATQPQFFFFFWFGLKLPRNMLLSYFFLLLLNQLSLGTTGTFCPRLPVHSIHLFVRFFSSEILWGAENSLSASLSSPSDRLLQLRVNDTLQFSPSISTHRTVRGWKWTITEKEFNTDLKSERAWRKLADQEPCVQGFTATSLPALTHPQ